MSDVAKGDNSILAVIQWLQAILWTWSRLKMIRNLTKIGKGKIKKKHFRAHEKHYGLLPQKKYIQYSI